MRNLVPVWVAGGLLLAAAMMPGQTAGPIVSFTAAADKIAGAPDAVRIDLFRWSTDAERDKLVAAWSMTNRAGRGGGGRGAGRGGRGGRGVADGGDPAPDPAAAEDPFGTFGIAARAGRGGRGRGAAPESAAPAPTPEGTLATALKQASTVGYLWSSETAGYAIRYAGRIAGSAGAERILLVTDRRLGKTTDFWTPTSKTVPSTYDFSLIELRVNAKGEGEGRISLTGKVAPDGAAKIVAPENYDALPVVLKNVKRKVDAGHREAK